MVPRIIWKNTHDNPIYPKVRLVKTETGLVLEEMIGLDAMEGEQWVYCKCPSILLSDFACLLEGKAIVMY